jgi:hypothetical protein
MCEHEDINGEQLMAFHTDITAAASVTEALAEHGHGAIGGMLPLRDLTKITLRRSWPEGGEFVATVAGHLKDGDVVQLASGTYRVQLVGAKAVA